jgi:hypothetical protein
MGLTIKRSWFHLWQGQEIFLFSDASTLTLGLTHFPIQRVPGALTMGVKRQECEANCGALPDVEVYNVFKL